MNYPDTSCLAGSELIPSLAKNTASVQHLLKYTAVLQSEAKQKVSAYLQYIMQEIHSVPGIAATNDCLLE
jgi:hypothetical protein